jgi:hypothetical protein
MIHSRYSPSIAFRDWPGQPVSQSRFERSTSRTRVGRQCSVLPSAVYPTYSPEPSGRSFVQVHKRSWLISRHYPSIRLDRLGENREYLNKAITKRDTLSVNRCFGGTCRTESQAENKLFLLTTLLHASVYFFCSLFDPEDSGDMFFRNLTSVNSPRTPRQYSAQDRALHNRITRRGMRSWQGVLRPYSLQSRETKEFLLCMFLRSARFACPFSRGPGGGRGEERGITLRSENAKATGGWCYCERRGTGLAFHHPVCTSQEIHYVSTTQPTSSFCLVKQSLFILQIQRKRERDRVCARPRVCVRARVCKSTVT